MQHANTFEYKKKHYIYATHSLCTSSGPRAEGVPTDNQRIRALYPLRRFGQVQLYSPAALLVRVQHLMKDMYKVVEGRSTRPIVLSVITGSYFRRRRRFTIFEPDETKFSAPLALFSL